MTIQSVDGKALPAANARHQLRKNLEGAKEHLDKLAEESAKNDGYVKAFLTKMEGIEFTEEEAKGLLIVLR